MKWATKDDFSIELEDKPGQLAELSAKLQDAGISLLGIWGDHGVDGRENFRCVPQSAKKFRAFAQEHGLTYSEGMTIYLHGDDSAGALTETLEEIATAGVSIRSIHAVTVSNEFGAFIWVDQKDFDVLARTLG
jgi:hypothetical protein